MPGTSSKSSPMLSASRPPTSTRMSRRNMPKAPLIRIRAPNRDHPVRPSMKARRYSTTWIRASRGPGMRTWTMRPSRTRAAVDGPYRPTGRHGADGVVRERLGDPSSESGSRIESASTIATRGSAAALIPTLTASDRPLFSLRTTTSRVRPLRGTQDLQDRRTRRHVGRELALHRHEVERRAQASHVPSVLPSSTTTTSCRG